MMVAPIRGFYTYVHCRPDGSPFYVGKGGGNARSKRYSLFKNRSCHHKNIVAKYGRENILIFIFPCESEKQAFADEMQQIAQFRCEGYTLCNLTDGGEGATNPSDETRQKMSNAHLGKQYALGYKHSASALARISEASHRLWTDDAHRRHMSDAMKVRIFTDEHCDKISKAKKGKGSPWSPLRWARHIERKSKT